MVTKVWNGSSAVFIIASNWSPAGVPVSGDTAIINGGVVSLDSVTLDGFALMLDAPANDSPTLVATNATFGSAEAVSATAHSNSATIIVAGTLLNSGLLTLTGNEAGTATVLLPGDTASSVLANQGSLVLAGNTQIALQSSRYTTGLVNNGFVSINNPTGTFHLAAVRVAVSGTGIIQVNDKSYVEFSQSVGAGQTLQFAPGASATVQIDAANQFQGRFSGFAVGDKISLPAVPSGPFTYETTGPTSGALVYAQNGIVLDRIAFTGDYALNSFDVTKAASGSTVITATGAAPQRVAYTDITTGANGGDAATYYTGPVNYLQWQYIWNSPDGVAMAGQSDNMFLHGGSGADAISAHGGSNVIDGGAGSNFLVGATGADGGSDTFYIDGRGGAVTWGSIVNFHHGDAATVFGFNDNSTLPAFTVDGATGYTGATIHSELGGAGSGINGSLTFVGLSVADAQSKLTVQTGHFGTAGQAYYLGYLYIAYTG